MKDLDLNWMDFHARQYDPQIGRFLAVDLGFLKELLAKAKEVRFNSPETNSIKTFDEIIYMIDLYTYVDLVIGTDHLDINGKTISGVFINLGRDKEDMELLLFFDSNGLSGCKYPDS